MVACACSCSCARHQQASSKDPAGAWTRFGPNPSLTWTAAGFGRTRFISRYCRNLVPWLPVPRWLFGIALNAFVDQVRGPQDQCLLRAAYCILGWPCCAPIEGPCPPVCAPLNPISKPGSGLKAARMVLRASLNPLTQPYMAGRCEGLAVCMEACCTAPLMCHLWASPAGMEGIWVS